MTQRVVLAADVGGTQMRAALVDAAGGVVLRETTPTPSDANVPAALIELIADVGRVTDHGDVSHAVIGLPGAVDYEVGQLLWAPHLPDSWLVSLSTRQLSEHIGLRTYVANDADMAAIGEATFGAGAGIDDIVVYLTVSTGVGAGVVHRRRLVRGRHSLGEVGHSVIDWRAWSTGRPGTLEDLASGSGIAHQAGEAGLGQMDAQGVLDAALEGDSEARRIWEDAVTACAAGICNLVMTFAPSTVIVGGGIGRRKEFFGPLRELVLQRDEHRPTDLSVVPGALGDDAGLVGAAAWERATARRD